MSKFGCGIDKLEFNWFESGSGGLFHEGFSESDTSFFWTTDTTFYHDKVRFDKTIVDKTTNRVDRFICDINSGSSVISNFFTVNGVVTSSDSVNLFVDFGTVMVSLLT